MKDILEQDMNYFRSQQARKPSERCHTDVARPQSLLLTLNIIHILSLCF